MKYFYFEIFISLLFVSCGLFESNDNSSVSDKVYVAFQGLDQVGIVDINSGEIDIIDINYATTSCMNYDSEMDCNMASDCTWHDTGTMSHCMDAEDNCIGLNETQCSITGGCEWMMNMCMESGGMMEMGSHTPHFIVIDEINRYWFVTTITSGYVARYNLDTDVLIDKIIVDDSPALMVINEENKKLYVSRMMPMAGMMMGSVSTIVQEIDYADSSLMVLSNEFSLSSPAPHGLAINSDGSEVYVASNTADWLWKINTVTGATTGSVMDENIGNAPSIETQRLKPIQIASVEDSMLFVTCSGGIWYNAFTGKQDTIPGQVQLWNSNSMKLIDSYNFEWYSTPWHIINSSINDVVCLTLSGDQTFTNSNDTPSAGIACLTYQSYNLDLFP